MPTQLDVNVRGGKKSGSCPIVSFGIGVGCPSFSVPQDLLLKKRIAGKEDLKEGGWMCLRIASNSGLFLFRSFVCIVSFIVFYGLPIFVCFLFLVITRISTRLNQITCTNR